MEASAEWASFGFFPQDDRDPMGNGVYYLQVLEESETPIEGTRHPTSAQALRPTYFTQ